MPLLNKKPLELHRYNKKLSDDAEVFYCKHTNEIFEDYEEYCQRVIACNSLIWTCAITGKTNLTYQEALASEQNAMKTVKDFPLELRNPILYLASRANRRNLSDLMNDVFNFVKDRYFLGESVEACFDGVWVFAHVLQVMLPTEQEVEEYQKQNNITGPISSRPYPGVLYKYEVEQLDDDNEAGISEIRILTGDKIHRIKGVYTKEKNKIYIKQFAEYKAYRWRIQKNILSKYCISSISFSNMFVGEPPIFDDSVTGEPKYSQQSIDMYLMKDKSKIKNNELIKKKGVESMKNIQKKYQLTIDKVVEQARKEVMKKEALDDKAKKVEELKKKKQQELEERAKLANFIKEWERKRDDLECEDLKVLPTPCPVDCRVPNEHFGDLVMILEFLSSFKSILKVRDYFPYGLNFELLERALVEVEIAGPFCDILQLLLNAVFSLQEQEDSEFQSNDRYYSSKDIDLDEGGDISLYEAVKLATIAAGWSENYHGVPLNKLFLDAITISEILRLHFLSSGGRTGEQRAKWQFQERGGYRSSDDPCLMLRTNEPHILRFLAIRSVAELSIADKIKVLTCLMNQIITYADLRDIIEEGYEKIKGMKVELKNDQIAESKKGKEIMSQKLKEKREAKKLGQAVSQELEEQIEKFLEESNKKKAEFQKRAAKIQKAALEYQIVPLGRDRAYRKFWMFNTIGGLFVEDNEEFPGSCLTQPTPITRNVENLEEDTTTYVRKLFEEERNSGSDKENEGNFNHPLSSPKKKLLSESNDLSNTPNPNNISVVKEGGEEKVPTLVCTGNRETCTVHTLNKQGPRWFFFYNKNDIEELINCLNKRGHREHRLRKALIEAKDNIITMLPRCPVNLLNRVACDVQNPSSSTVTTRSQKGYKNSNLKYPPGTPVQEILELYIREIILDIEEKIFGGGLGAIKVKDRQSWRRAIECRSYERQDDNLTWRQYSVRKEKLSDKIREEDTSRPDTPCSMDSNPEHDALLVKVDSQNQVVKDLASAVLQIARAVEPKYLRKPLGGENKKDKFKVMERWESSLMISTSFAQVYLHIATLENSVQWNRSALYAKCKICKRGRDEENMLLCDSCDGGFHLYCLKPKLTSIPQGDWFCDKCKPKEVVEEKKRRRSRRLFTEESDEGSQGESDDDLPLAEGRVTRSKGEENSKKRKITYYEGDDDDDDDDDDDSSSEPLSKIARTQKLT